LCAQIVPRLINPCLYQGCRVLRRLPVRTLYRCTEALEAVYRQTKYNDHQRGWWGAER
jgi:hypothetical protein